MTRDAGYDSGTESPRDFVLGESLSRSLEEARTSSSTGDLAKIFGGQQCGFSSPSSWTREELRTSILAYLGLIGINNWSWLGNSSDVNVPEELAHLLGHLGFKYEEEHLERPASSTSIKLEYRRDISGAVENLFSVARSEVFEDGMESQFSRELLALIKRYREQAILEAARLITSEKADPAVASEALKWLGRVKEAATHSFRRWLLIRGLTSSSSQVRDGAGLGLSFLNDPAAIPALEEAIEREKIRELRDDLGQVVQQLRHAS